MPLYLGNRPIGGTNVSFTPGTGGSEDLTAVLNEQDAIITRLETALEGKASGSGSVVYNATITGSEISISYFDQDGIVQVLHTPGTIQPLNGVIVNNTPRLELRISGDYLDFTSIGVLTYIIKSDVSITIVGGGSD